jgi:succinate-semialdehyde dehydrogenase / glutarate-semialdehyde dehydrogenase
MPLQSINPTNDAVLSTYQEMSPSEVADIVDLTHAAHLAWRTTSFDERAGVLRRAAQVLRSRSGEWAQLMAAEMGKPVRDGVAEAHKCADCCDYFAEHGAAMLAREPVRTDDQHDSFVLYQPLGVVLAVMPWNFPFWQAFRALAPALMAGNAIVLKHASNVCGCAIALERILRDAGAPDHLFRTLLIGSSRVDAVIEHPVVRAVTLTGSSDAGRAVAGKAGQVLKKCVLELGGSDAYLVLEDADLEQAATVCAKARLVNGGQSCIAGKRFLVVDAVREEFEKRFVAKMQAVRQGDPLDQATEIGPMARRDLRDQLQQQVTASVERGARCLLGGSIPEGPGAFYPPTVLTDVRPGMPAYDEEVFGPVAAIIPVRDEAAAIEVANDSMFGLGGGVITRDLARGERVAAALECGCVFVNEPVRSDSRLPFGGVKQSGYGRELAVFGIREFVNVKSVVVNRK